MDFALSPEQQAVADVAREFTRKELIPHELRYDAAGEIPLEDFRRLRKQAAELGFLGVDYPEEVGGLGLGVMGMALVREEMGATSQALRFTSNAGPVKMLLNGTPEQQERYLRPSLAGELIAAFAVTEPAAGADPAGMETSARRDGEGWVLNGMKHYISLGPIADFVIVFAVTDPARRARGGISAFIVEKGTPGFSVGRIQTFIGWRGVPQGELVFQDCRLGPEQLLGDEGRGFNVVMQFLDQGRLAVAASSIGSAQRCQEMAVSYARTRTTFGAPLADRQAVQWMLADSALDIHAARLMVRHAAWKLDRGERATQESSMCKLFATEMATRVVDRAMQIHGGAGVSKDLPLEMHYRDLRLHRVGEGPSEIQRMIIARSLLA